MADDSILITFSADVASYEKSIDQVEAKTLGLQKVADDTSKRFGNIGKGNTFAALNKGVKDTTQEISKVNREIKKTGEEAGKGAKTASNAFLELRKELKKVQGELATLAIEGKENTEEFKKLQIQAGALKDQMGDLQTAINLTAGAPLENLGTGFQSLKGSIASLDFEGVGRAFSALGTNVSQIDLKSFQDGIAGAAQGVVKLGAAILTSPLFLVAGAVVGIIAAIVTWGDSMEDIAKRNDRAVERIMKSLEATTAEYERQIKLNEALGKSTDKAEDARIRAIIRGTKQAIEIKEREIAEFEKLNKKAAALGIQQDLEDVERFKSLTDSKFELEQQLADARNDLRVKDAQAQTDASEKAEEEAKKNADKAKADAEKRAAEIAAAQKALQQSQINLLEEGQRKQRQQIRFDFEQKLDAIKGQSEVEKALRISLEKEMQVALDKVAEETREKKIALIKIEGADRIREVKQLTGLELEIAQSGADSIDQFYAMKRADRLAALNKDIETMAAFGNSIVEIGKSVSTLLSENQQEAAENSKLFAAFGIGLNLATSLSQMVAGAAAAAAATGPAAPFTLVAYIAQGTALVLGAFAQIKSLLEAPVPKAAAKGEEYVTGGQRGKDSVLYNLMPGERVVTTAVNEKYYDVLHAMHTGNERAILPALRRALGAKAESDNDSFASNIANSLMLNRDNWKGGNIVDKLAWIDKNESKRNQQLVNALRTRSTYRKK